MVDRDRDFFTGQPFILKYDTNISLRTIIQDLLAQANQRPQDNNLGTMYAGAVLQHLVSAILSLVLSDEQSFSEVDARTGGSGDFVINDVIIHVTTAPSEALLRKCLSNLGAGNRPLIITTYENMPAAESLAKIQGIEGEVDIFEIEQFISTNIYKLSKFSSSEIRITIERFAEKYNEIVKDVEADPCRMVCLDNIPTDHKNI